MNLRNGGVTVGVMAKGQAYRLAVAVGLVMSAACSGGGPSEEASSTVRIEGAIVFQQYLGRDVIEGDWTSCRSSTDYSGAVFKARLPVTVADEFGVTLEIARARNLEADDGSLMRRLNDVSEVFESVGADGATLVERLANEVNWCVLPFEAEVERWDVYEISVGSSRVGRFELGYGGYIELNNGNSDVKQTVILRIGDPSDSLVPLTDSTPSREDTQPTGSATVPETITPTVPPTQPPATDPEPTTTENDPGIFAYVNFLEVVPEYQRTLPFVSGEEVYGILQLPNMEWSPFTVQGSGTWYLVRFFNDGEGSVEPVARFETPNDADIANVSVEVIGADSMRYPFVVFSWCCPMGPYRSDEMVSVVQVIDNALIEVTSGAPFGPMAPTYWSNELSADRLELDVDGELTIVTINEDGRASS